MSFIDEPLETWDQFILAVRTVSLSSRPELTLVQAHQEALQDWIAQAAIDQHSEPFQPLPAT